MYRHIAGQALILFSLACICAMGLAFGDPAKSDDMRLAPANRADEQERPSEGQGSVHTSPDPVTGDARPEIPQTWLGRVTAELRQNEYNFSESGDGSWGAPNRAHDLRTRVTHEGIEVVSRLEGPDGSAGGWRLGIRLESVGRAGALAPVAPADLLVENDRAELRRGAVTEWYLNTNRGLKQGFTIGSPPDRGDSDLPVILDMALSGGLGGRVCEDEQAVLFERGNGKTVLRYGGLRVQDGTGRECEAWLNLSAGHLQIRIDDAGVVYPLLVDPLMTSPAWSAESDQESATFAGSAAGDVNGDGYSDVIVFSQFYDNGDRDEGKAWVYHGSPSGLAATPSWTAEGNQLSARFGLGVSAGDVNGDGYDDLLVSSYLYANPEPQEGKVWVYHGSPSGLSPVANWTAESNTMVAQFGFSITAGDVNGDGFFDVTVGAYLYQDPDTHEFLGKVYTYHGSPTGLSVTPDWTHEGDQDGARFGYSVSSEGDINGDGYFDLIVGDPYYDGGQTDEGRAWAFYGSATGLHVAADWSVEINQADAAFGHVSTAGDVNGDGYSDVIIGAPEYDNGESGEGGAWLYLGSSSGLSPSPAWAVEANQTDADLGRRVAPAGDINGDGYADVIVSLPWYDKGEPDEGMVWVYEGSASGLSPVPDWTTESNEVGALLFGQTAGDVNGDGYADVIVSAYYRDNGETDEGVVSVYHGSAAGLAAVSAWSDESDQAGAQWGVSLASAGDVNGDGYSDVIVGAPEYDNGEADEGMVFVYYGSAAGLHATPDWSAESNQANAAFGRVSTAGDVNGDGYSDVIIGAPEYDNGEADEGMVFVYHGSRTGLSLSPDWTCEGDQAGARLGHSVSTAGDINGDGLSDVIIGAPFYDNGETNEGAAFAYYGSDSGLSVLPVWIAEGDQSDAQLGECVCTAGDVNGDGYSDVVIGAPYYDNGEVNEGVAFVYHGSGRGLSVSPDWVAEGNQADAAFGRVHAAGDVNGDGYSDIVIGAPYYDNGEADEGMVFVFNGSVTGLSASADWTAESDQAGAQLGERVCTAGDVNGDGYSDIVVGAPYYDNGETDEGMIFVWHGSATGLGSLATWTAESDQAKATLGGCAAGDVNGDGYSDIIAAAPFYDNGESDEGRLFVYLGNNGAGLDRIPRQARCDDSAPIDILGRSYSPTSFLLKALGRTPLGRGNVRLEWEVAPLGTPLDGTGIRRGSFVNTGAPSPGTGSAVNLDELEDSLTSGDPVYHWRLRIASDHPFFPRSPWFSLPHNCRTETDLRTKSVVIVAEKWPVPRDMTVPGQVLWNYHICNNGTDPADTGLTITDDFSAASGCYDFTGFDVADRVTITPQNIDISNITTNWDGVLQLLTVTVNEPFDIIDCLDMEVSVDVPAEAPVQCCNTAIVDYEVGGLPGRTNTVDRDTGERESCFDVTAGAEVRGVKVLIEIAGQPASDPPVAHPGDTLHYMVALTNVGNEEAQAVAFHETWDAPPNAGCIDASSLAPSDITVQNSTFTLDDTQFPAISITDMIIPASQSVVIHINSTNSTNLIVSHTAPEGQCCNLSGGEYNQIPDDPGSPVLQYETTYSDTVPPPAPTCMAVEHEPEARLSAEKDVTLIGSEIDPPPPRNASPGDEVAYRISLTEEDGIADATQVRVSDTLDEACIDLSNFDPNDPSDLVVTGSTYSLDLTDWPPTLVLTDITAPMGPTNAVTIDMNHLAIVDPDPADPCCNTAEVSYLARPGDPVPVVIRTDDPDIDPGTDDDTCIATAGSALNFRREGVNTDEDCPIQGRPGNPTIGEIFAAPEGLLLVLGVPSLPHYEEDFRLPPEAPGSPAGNSCLLFYQYDAADIIYLAPATGAPYDPLTDIMVVD